MKRIAMLTLAAGLAISHHAGAATLQPGAIMETSAGQCTMNFVFDGLGPRHGKVYIGTAAHCATEVGDVALEGWPRTIVFGIDPEPVRFGTVVAMGDPASVSTDWALIEVDPGRERDVSPQLKGHPDLPRGVELRSPSDVARGDLVQFSGYPLALDQTPESREQRVAVFNQWVAGQSVELVGPASFGDSGGPIVHLPTGRPLSLHSRFGGLYSIPIANLIDGATAVGYPVAVRTLDSPPVPPPPPPAPSPSPGPAASPAPPPPATPKKAGAKKKKKKKNATKKKKKKRKGPAARRKPRDR